MFQRRWFIAPTVLTNQDWQELQVPTLFLVGENDVTYSAEQAVQRLNRVAPQIKTGIVLEADHHLALVKPRWISDKALDYLRRERT